MQSTLQLMECALCGTPISSDPSAVLTKRAKPLMWGPDGYPYCKDHGAELHEQSRADACDL